MRPKTALFATLSALALLGAEASSPMMKALVIHSFGGPEVLKYEDVPPPEPSDEQVLVRVVAAALTRWIRPCARAPCAAGSARSSR